jgi:translation initiation factor 5B
MAETRSLICTFVGHVDHGKSSLQDKIRETSIVKGEAGAITQAIGASIIPLETIKDKCGALLKAANLEIDIPGLLFIDTPGHAAFTNLRKRGGSLADIAVLVVDINEGLMPQTIESIEILKANKTPFVVAANKIDKLSGWSSNKDPLVLKNISLQAETTRRYLDQKIYELVGKFHEDFGFESERFDRVSDPAKQLSIVPVSAITGEGLSELLMVIIGLAQKYMKGSLQSDIEGPGKGIILEVKETAGLGTTVDVILFDGHLKRGDNVVLGGLDGPVITKIKALLEPAKHAEMMDKKTKYTQVEKVEAATGVKVAANNLDKVIAGMPLQVYHTEDDLEKMKEEVQELVNEILIETEEEGLILKADTLGSLEALTTLFQEKKLPIRKATLGDVSKKDVVEAISNKEEDELFGVVIGFNVNIPQDVASHASEQEVEVITGNVIYHLIDEYELWKGAKLKKLEEKKLETLTRPFKLEVLQGYVFRQSNPAVCGVEVLQGKLKSGVRIMKTNADVVDVVKQIQKEKDTVSEAERGSQVAISLPKTTVGRQIVEGDILFSFIPEEDFKELKRFKKLLSNEEREVLKEIAGVMRKKEAMWGI